MFAARRLLIVVLAAASAAAVLPSAASAQATRTWVSGVGDDVNPCSRTAPCKTFAGAISKTAARGEINVLDPGGFGAVTITKSLTIRAQGLTAGALAGGTAIRVNAAATDKVIIDGLDIFGVNPPTSGIVFQAGKSLFVKNSNIQHWPASGFAIKNQSSTPNSRLVIDNVDVFDNAGEAISISPTGAGSATTIRRSNIFDNAFGVIAGGAVASTTTITDSSIVDNGTGIFAFGAPATIRLGRNVITGNGNGLNASNGGQIVSFGNNEIAGNGGNQTPTATIATSRR